MMHKRLPIIIGAAGIWITFSEFFRNEILFKSIWEYHYRLLGLTFTTTPTNGLLWFAWSLITAAIIYILLKRFSGRETLAIVWVMDFFLMWITLYNLQVLPIPLLLAAIPLSILEIGIAILIIRRVKRLIGS